MDIFQAFRLCKDPGVLNVMFLTLYFFEGGECTGVHSPMQLPTCCPYERQSAPAVTVKTHQQKASFLTAPPSLLQKVSCHIHPSILQDPSQTFLPGVRNNMLNPTSVLSVSSMVLYHPKNYLALLQKVKHTVTV